MTITEVHTDDAPEALPRTENYRVFRWDDNGRVVYFSICRQGDVAPIHLCAETRRDKQGLRKAVNEFCDAVFQEFEWCSKVVGFIGPQTVVNLSKKCGFDVVHVFGVDPIITLVERTRI